MNRKRLLKLADYLEKIPNRAFDMRDWSRIVDGKVMSEQHVKNQFKCGMAACLGGHASLVFPRLLTLKKRGLELLSYSALYYKTEIGRFAPEGSEAFSKAFDLCSACAEEITSPDAMHKTPKRAAKILRLVANRKPFRIGVDIKAPTIKCKNGSADCYEENP